MLGVGDLTVWFVANKRGDNGIFGEVNIALLILSVLAILEGCCSGVKKSLENVKGEDIGDLS